MLKHFETWRYPQVDASEQAGWNFIITRSDDVDFPKGLSAVAKLKLLDECQCGFRKRTMGMQVLGYACATLPHKIEKFS